MSLNAIALIGVGVLLLLLFLGMNIGGAMLVVGFVGYAWVINIQAALGLFQTQFFTTAASYTLSVLPLFVLMGEFCYCSGLSRGLFNLAERVLGRLPGSLACASVVACAGFGAICGSPTATAATMGVVACPEMKAKGYADSLAAGSVSVGGTLGIMIPPSSAFIVYGVLMGESIGKLFAAGIIPGIILAILCCFVIVILVKRDPSLAPAGEKYSAREKLAALKGIWGVAVLFLVVIGGIFIGRFTPNEGAAIGCLLGLIYMIITGNFNWENAKFCAAETAKAFGMTFLIVIGATIFGSFLAITRMPMALAAWVETLNVSRYLILFFILLVYAFLGMIMDAMAMLMLTVPIFSPVVLGLGFDGIWFGVMMVLVMELGLVTPPVGLNCYVMAGICKGVPLSTIFKGSLPFAAAIFVAILLIVFIPGLATWLPGLM